MSFLFAQVIKSMINEYQKKVIFNINTSKLPSKMTKKSVQEWLESKQWRTSVSPFSKHQYLTEEEAWNVQKLFNIKAENYIGDLFEIADWIDTHAFLGTYGNMKAGKNIRVFKYIYFGEYKYWVIWYIDCDKNTKELTYSLRTINRSLIDGKEKEYTGKYNIYAQKMWIEGYCYEGGLEQYNSFTPAQHKALRLKQDNE